MGEGSLHFSLSSSPLPPRNTCYQAKTRRHCCFRDTISGVANGTSKNVGLGKFWQDLEISEAFLISLEVSFLHGFDLLFLSLETFYLRVSGSDF